MFPTFCATRCREKNGKWVQELFPTHPTYQNPIFMNFRPLFGKFFWFFGFSSCQFLGQTILKSLGLGFVGPKSFYCFLFESKSDRIVPRGPGPHGVSGPKGKGPKKEPKERAQRKGPKEGRGPYSLMDHQWIHWWSLSLAPFFGLLSLGPSLWAPWGPGRHLCFF